MIDSKTWSISAPPHGVFVQYSANETGNARFSGLAIDVLNQVQHLASLRGTPFQFDLHLPGGDLFHDAVNEVVDGTRDLLWSGARLMVGQETAC